MPRLLVGKIVNHRFAELDVLVGSDCAQVLHAERMPAGLLAALDFQGHLIAHMLVQHILQREEFRDRLAVDRNQDVARRQYPGGR